MAAPAAAAAAAAAPPCVHCGGPGALRCAGCRAVHYCSRACQKAAWPGHKAHCKHMLSERYGGQQLASERGFVREYWAPRLPDGCNVDALVGPPGEPLDAAAAFERCQAAAMNDVIFGWSRMSEGERGAYDAASILAVLAAARARGEDNVPSGADLAVACIGRLCSPALEKLLDAGVEPGDVSVECGYSLLQAALYMLNFPYPQSPAALPHALAVLRMLLARVQSRDWLVSRAMHASPLNQAAAICDTAVSLAVLDVIVASPGGFPAHAVAASPGILLLALQRSTPAFVSALLAAGADATVKSTVPTTGSIVRMALPLHALALENPHGDPRDFRAKLRLLLDAGADLEAIGEFEWTALVEAAMNERAAAFDALLAAGAQASALRANVGADATDFTTVLHGLAAMNDASLIPRVLATRALDVDVRIGPAHNRCTPLHLAASHDAPRAVTALLAGGASLTATTADGLTALQLAISRSSVKAARPLLEASPRAERTRLRRDAARVEAACARAAAARPGDAAAAAKLAAAREVATLLAA